MTSSFHPQAGSALHRAGTHQCGQAATEYAVVCAVLAFVLFYPIQDGVSPDKSRTTVQIVLEAFKTAYQNFSYAISLPS